MTTATYRFFTGEPNITPAVYATSDDAEASDLNTASKATDSAGVLTLTLDVGHYYARWQDAGSSRRASGEPVAATAAWGMGASPGVAVVQGEPATVSGWSVFAGAGSLITLDDDGHTWHVGPGLYQLQLGAAFTGDQSSATVEAVGAGGVTDDAYGFGPMPVYRDGIARLSRTFGTSTGKSFIVLATPTGGTDDSTLDYVEMDIVRLGDLDPAVA